jgi:ketosteroid isomerase-like protein
VSGAGSGNAETVRGFYRAARDRDADAVRALVRQRFAEDATLTWPDSLPYGGTVTGRTRLERVLSAAAGCAEPAGPKGLTLVDLVDGGDRIAALLRFDWHAPRGAGVLADTSAVELWTFEKGLVCSIWAYYWDTAACAALLRES